MTDVARLANVSQTTVSFVVNNLDAGLPERTKRKVLVAVLRRRGVRVPEEIAVVGCAGVPAAADPAYDLTTLDLRHDLVGQHAVEMVLRMIKGEDLAGSGVVVRPELIVRSSA